METPDTLELILSYHKTCLAKIASTCKKWNSINSKCYDDEKMSYLQNQAFLARQAVYNELDKEMFNVSNGFGSNDQYHSEWRNDNENFHEANWYAFREFSFFFDYKMSLLYNKSVLT